MAGGKSDRTYLRIVFWNRTTELAAAGSAEFFGESVNKRKRVALAKRRTKKRKLKARAQTAR